MSAEPDPPAQATWRWPPTATRSHPSAPLGKRWIRRKIRRDIEKGMPSIYSVMMPLGSILPKRTGYLFRRNQHHHFYRRSVQLFEKFMGCGPEFFERRYSIYLVRCSPPLRNTYFSMSGVPRVAAIPNSRSAGKSISKPAFFRYQSWLLCVKCNAAGFLPALPLLERSHICRCRWRSDATQRTGIGR